jgi:hypothetical protein
LAHTAGENLANIAAKLHIRIERDQKHLQGLRDGWGRSHEMLEAAQIEGRRATQASE